MAWACEVRGQSDIGLLLSDCWPDGYTGKLAINHSGIGGDNHGLLPG